MTTQNPSAEVPTTKWWHSSVYTQAGIGFPLNLPTLTSVFTPPSSCDSVWFLSRSQTISYYGESGPTVIKVSEESVDYVVHRKIVKGGTGNEIDEQYLGCQPSGGEQSFSPGVCPSGYTIDVVTAVPIEETSVSGSVVPRRTTYLGNCCPTGMSLGPTATSGSFSPIACYSNVSRTISALEPYTHNGDSNSVFWQLTVDRTVLDNATSISRGVAVADAYEVGWDLQDLNIFPTRYASSLARKADLAWGSSTAAPGSTSGAPKETGGSTQQENPSSSGGLSTGAKAGIAVGVVGAVLIGVIILWLLIRRRKRNKKESPVVPDEGNTVAEMEDQDQDLATRKWYLGGKWRNELKANEQLNEPQPQTVHVVPGPPVELSTDNR